MFTDIRVAVKRSVFHTLRLTEPVGKILIRGQKVNKMKPCLLKKIVFCKKGVSNYRCNKD